MSFEVRLTVTPATVSLEVAGDLDGTASHMFQGPAHAALQLEQPEITIDFARLKHMDPAAAGMLILFDAAAKACGKTVVIVNPSPSILEAMERTHLVKLIAIR